MAKEAKKIKGVYEKVPGSAIWWIRYADASGRIRREKVGTKSAAIQLYRKRKTEVSQGKKLPENLRTCAKVGDLAPAMQRDYEINKRKSDDSVERRLRLHILPFFEHLLADAVSTDDIDQYVDQRRDEGAQNATINRELAVLKRMYSLAWRSKPRRVREIPSFPVLKESPPRKGFVEDEQFERLKGNTHELWLKAIITVGYTFGFRRSELLTLKVKQVDLKRRTLHLESGETKNDDARTVVMTQEVFDLITQCVQCKNPDDYVFTRVENQPVLDFRGAWFVLCDKAGLGEFVEVNGKSHWEGLIFHDLRRSAVRNMVRHGISEKVAMTISGHKTRSVFDRYNIVSEADIADAASKIELGRHKNNRATTDGPTDTKTDTTPMHAPVVATSDNLNVAYSVA
jgi:integrase